MSPTSSRPARHVVLVTYGEPQTPAFVEQLGYSWRILLGLTRTIAPIPRPVIPMIALSRARGRARMWNDERYSSPLEPITLRQAALMRETLPRMRPDTDWHVHVAYEFRRPLLADVLGSIPASEPATVVPMYATESAFTHGLSRTVAATTARTLQRRAPIHVLPALPPDELAAVSVAHIRAAIHDDSGWRGRGVALVLAAHGTLLEPARPIDTGLAATERLARAIRARLNGDFGDVIYGWLNHTRGGRWTDPPIDAALRQVRNAGYRRAVYFPYGFLADNAESQLEGRLALTAESALEHRHLPCLNDSPALIEALARQVTLGLE